MPYKKEKGQTFVIMLMIMSVALIFGVTIASRFMKNIRSMSETDNSSKALQVADAAVERILLVPYATLQTYVSNNSCGSACSLQITDANGQKLTASVKLSFIGNSTNSYAITVPQDEVASVSLAGYQSGRNVYVCWNGDTSITGYYVYTQSSVVKATPFAYNAVLTQNNSNGFSSTSASFGYQNCFSVSATQTPQAIRLHSISDRTDAFVVPEAGFSIPIQGIQIEATGKAGEATKKVTVIKSTSFAPSYFDYTLYQKSPSSTLSN